MRKKKRTKHITITIGTIIKSFLPLLVCLGFCWIFLCANSHVDSSNTYTVECTVQDIYYDTPKKGKSTGIITMTNGEVYTVYSRFLQGEETERLLREDRQVSLIVWDYPFTWSPLNRVIVDMRSESTVYHDIDEHNEYSKNQRQRTWYTLVPFFGIVGLFATGISFSVEFSDRIGKYFRRRKKKKKKELRRLSRDAGDKDAQ